MVKRLLWVGLAIVVLTAFLQQNGVKSWHGSNNELNSEGVAAVPLSHMEGTPLGPVTSNGNYTFAAYDPSTVFAFEKAGSGFGRVGRLMLDIGEIQAMAVAGNDLYVLSSGGLQVVDVTNPMVLRARGFYPVEGGDGLVIENHYAYITTAEWLHIFNVTDPYHPSHAGYYPRQGMTVLEVAGDSVYLVDHRENYGAAILHIVSVANPAAPQLIGTYSYEEGPSNVILDLEVVGEQGHLLVENYVCGIGGCSGYYQWLVLDLTNPARPELVTLGTIWNLAGVTLPVSITVVGDRALVQFSSVLKMVNIANPMAPMEVAHYESAHEVTGATVAGNRAIMSSSGGLQMLDVSKPGQIEEIALHPSFWTRKVILRDDYAYLNSTSDDVAGIAVIDVSKPATPFIASQLVVNSAVERIHDFTIADGLVYVLLYKSNDGADHYLRVYQLQNGDPPLFKSEVFLGHSEGSHPRKIVVEGNFAYVIGGDRLSVVNVEDVLNLEVVDVAEKPSLDRMVIDDNYAYLTGVDISSWPYRSLFQVIDISNPYQIEEVVTVEEFFEGRPQTIEISGDYAYVVEFEGFLTVVDITSPDAPEVVNRNEAPSGEDMEIAGQHLYLTSYWEQPGLSIYSIADPRHPMLFSYYPAHGYSIDVNAENEVIAVAGGEIGLFLFRRILVEPRNWLPLIYN